MHQPTIWWWEQPFWVAHPHSKSNLSLPISALISGENSCLAWESLQSIQENLSFPKGTSVRKPWNPFWLFAALPSQYICLFFIIGSNFWFVQCHHQFDFYLWCGNHFPMILNYAFCFTISWNRGITPRLVFSFHSSLFILVPFLCNCSSTLYLMKQEAPASWF